MTAFLKLNGIAVPILDGSAEHDVEEIGKTERVVDASMVSHRRALKGEWGFSIAHQQAATALAFRDLLLGKGHVWSFDSHVYSSKGLGPSTLGSLTSYGTTKKFGAAGGRIVAGGSNAVFTNVWPSGSAWTVAYWLYASGAWYHAIETSTGLHYLDGSSTGSAVTDWVTFQSTGFTIVAHGAADRNFDDFVAVPYVIPSDWPAQMFAYNTAFSPLAKLDAAGDFIEGNAKTVRCIGSFEGADLVQGVSGGSFEQNLHVMKGRLREV